MFMLYININIFTGQRNKFNKNLKNIKIFITQKLFIHEKQKKINMGKKKTKQIILQFVDVKLKTVKFYVFNYK